MERMTEDPPVQPNSDEESKVPHSPPSSMNSGEVKETGIENENKMK